MIDGGKRNVLGVNINEIDYEATIEQVMRAARARQPLAVSALAVHGLMEGVLDARHRYRLNKFDLLVPDGQPVRWALNWLYRARLADRIYGPTLMLKLCERAAEESIPIFLFGGTEDLLAALSERLCRRFTGLRVAGRRPSRFRQLTSAERDEAIHEIRGSGAAITFVGLGCPRQEVWVYEFRESLSMPLLAVGAAFSFHAGRMPQAPSTLQRYGLEWVFRLAHEPRRLWKRYLLLNPLYVSLLSLQILGLRRFDPASAPQPTEELLYG